MRSLVSYTENLIDVLMGHLVPKDLNHLPPRLFIQKSASEVNSESAVSLLMNWPRNTAPHCLFMTKIICDHVAEKQ